ncbi:MAG TPA: hypothetical protein VM123_05950 [archaeon]|nr:hypothetical protein [archaeon]
MLHLPPVRKSDLMKRVFQADALAPGALFPGNRRTSPACGT